LEEVRVNYYQLREVEDIERDLLNPGGFIVGDGNSVVRVFSNMNVTNIAGSLKFFINYCPHQIEYRLYRLYRQSYLSRTYAKL